MGEPREEVFLQILTRMAMGELDLEIPITPAKDLLDAIGLGINMLCAELRYTTISHTELKSLFDTVLDLLVVVDNSGMIVEVNQAVLNLAGGAAEDWVGNPCIKLFDVPPNEFEKLKQRLATGERVLDHPCAIRCPDGSTVPLSVSAALLSPSDGKRHVVLVARDLRSAYDLLRHQAEVEAERRKSEELRLARDAAHAANEGKNLFIANVSHELRTPLTVILAVIEIFQRTSLSEAEQKRWLKSLHSSALSLKRMVEDLLDGAKADAGKLKIQPEDVPCKKFFQEIASTFEPNAAKRGLDFKLILSIADTLVISTDPLRLRQITENLLGNACKFTHKGEIRLEVSLPQDDCLQIQVSDTGIGIPSANQGGLFRPFAQADHTICRDFGGTGLGLALALKLARLLNGELTLVSSQAGVGSIFALKLPLKPLI